MAIGKVAEWTGAAIVNGVAIQAPRGLPLRVQTVSFTASAAATTNAIGGDCNLVGLWVDTNAFWLGEATPVAEAGDVPITAGVWFFYAPSAGMTHKISFVEQ
jgi:hypothetical protein